VSFWPDYLPYLLLTWAIELPVLLAVSARVLPWRRVLVAGFLATGLTHPLLWYVWPQVVPLERYDLFVSSGEGLVWLVETGVLYLVVLGDYAGPLPLPRWAAAAVLSLLANLTSFGVGLLL